MDPSTSGSKRKRSSSLESERNPSRIRLTTTRDVDVEDSKSAGGLLCARCAEVDFDAALSSEQEAILIEDLGPINEWSISSCSLCKLLASLISEGTQPPDDFQLRTINSYNSQVKFDLPLLQALPPRMLLGMRRKVDIHMQYLVPQFDGSGPIRPLKTASIDFSVLKSWLDLCQTMHTQVCTSQSREPISVRHLKLIDCHTRQIVPAKNADYITLSYVWGRSEQCTEYSEQLPRTLPRTIEDAIEVTQKLGFRYLWIDRYCINQQEKGHAYSQINQMDLIYQNSEVTIVAAAGEDPSYGLPGVSRRERRLQPQANIGATVFFSPLRETPIFIANSHWATRGWTYQEALLSRRRLVFTDEQVYFQCHGMHCYETLQIPWESLHAPDGQSLKEIYHLGGYDHGNGAVFPKGVGTDEDAVCKRISEYSSKSLTHQSDRLNAFLGILRVFENRGTHNCWGTPILTHSMGKSGINTGFLRGLCWTAFGAPRVREPHLPSWSWTGWSGPVRYNNSFITGTRTFISMVEISIELCDGSVLDWNQFQLRYTAVNNPTQLSHFIHVRAPTLEIHNFLKNGLRYDCEVKMNDGCFLRWTFDSSSGILDIQSCKAFILATCRHPRSDRDQIFVIFLKELEGRFERVWGGWLQSHESTLLLPNHEAAVSGISTLTKYGDEWDKALVLNWETHRVG